MTITAAADGSSLGNPGPTGWGWYVSDDCWAAGGFRHGTNNIGELYAVLDLLRQSAALDEPLVVVCDSQYVIKSVTQWMPGWKRRGWRKGDGKPVQNLELMQQLDAALAGRDVRFEWVKGHAGHPLNEAADRLANGAASAYQRGAVPDIGPGFRGDVDEPRARSLARAVAADAAAARGSFLTFDGLDGLEPETDRGDIETVIELERELLTDETREDRASVAALLAPDWHEIHPAGLRWSRAEFLAGVVPYPTPVELEVIEAVQIADDAILLIWRAIHDGGSVLQSCLWQRDSAGCWRQRFQHGTPES